MKSALLVPVAFGLLLAPPPAAAQTPSRPTLVLTIFAGATSGHTLWDVARQPFCVLQGSPPVQSCSSAYDTLRLTRDVTSSLTAGARAAYFPGPHVGYTAEVFYLGLPLDDNCQGLFFNTDPQADPTYGPRNAQLCDDITRASLSTSAIAFLGGVILRGAGGRVVSPYIRGALGVVGYSTGTVELSGAYVDAGTLQGRAVYVEDHAKTLVLSGQVAGGFTIRMGPGYQFDFELRDVMVPLKRVTGPSNDFLRPPTETRLYHHFALTFGLGVILEKSRGRRY